MVTPVQIEGEDLWQRISSAEALQAAWGKVQANGGSAGGDGISQKEFASDLFGNITQIRAELLSGSYRASQFRRVAIPKKKPGYRVLTIPSIRDRVVHTAIAQALTPIFEPLFEDGSFGYRPGRGVVHAVERIEMWHRRGYDTVIEADIVSYFDNIEHELLIEKLSMILKPLQGAAPVIALIERIIEQQAESLDTPARGLVQGSPLSPLLANLYLDALDEEIEELGVKIVRFADDFVILCKSERKARKVLDFCVDVLEQHGLKLHENGTRIVDFDKGFDFIGYLFLRTVAMKKSADPKESKQAPIKSHVTEEGIITLDKFGSRFDPGARVLYVLDADHTLTTRNKSFCVRRSDSSELIAIPHKRIGRIELSREASFTSAAISLSVDTGVELALLDHFGQTRGIVSSFNSRRAGLHFNQARSVLSDSFCLIVSQALVSARIKNQRTQLMRLNRNKNIKAVQDTLKGMMLMLRKVPFQKAVNELRGVEGATTAQYWQALALLAGLPDTPFRRSRPAKDAFNASLNYLTGILERDIRAAIQGASLHQGFAFLHASRDRHDGLVFDLMEPFRAPLTEGICVYLFTASRLRENMFDTDGDGGVLIFEEGRKAIVRGYESAVSRRINRSDGKGRLAWRPMMLHQARSLSLAVNEGDPCLFVPYLMEA